MNVQGGSGGLFPREILKNQVVEVHFFCILRNVRNAKRAGSEERQLYSQAIHCHGR